MPNPFNQGNYEFMPPPPPKKKSALPPPKKSGGRQLQINRTFDSLPEMNAYLANNFKGQDYKVVKTWEVSQIHCIIELKD